MKGLEWRGVLEAVGGIDCDNMGFDTHTYMTAFAFQTSAAYEEGGGDSARLRYILKNLVLAPKL